MQLTLDQVLVVALLGLPLLGFALSGLIGRRLYTKAWIIAVPIIIATWLIGMYLVYQTLIVGAFDEGMRFTLYEWIPAGDFTVSFNFLVDNLTAVLLIVVTTVGMLVHVYSIGYMAHEPGRWRFFAYLNLFMFSMLLLVLAGNFLLLFAAWELVGLSSYLLIGYWYNRRTAALAAKKAFLVNRVGDFGFALGIMAIWTTVGTLNFVEMPGQGAGAFELLPSALEAGSIAPWMMIGIVLLLFMGAMGKSAQFPLHVWLPDAMEGPTPVSALIHAATMVNAGVYFVARSSPLFAHAAEAMVVVAAIGIFTAILAASIAFTQRDIKRVLAYSTLSQLGYMFAALGVGAFTAAIFHLVTHGFFKGLLFLGSGSVIHAVQGEQDMNKMGGLARKIPITHLTMLIGSIAIAGIPPLAGFWSKDEILGESFLLGFQWVWAIGVVVAVMTGFYMFRLMGKTFYGPSRVDPAVEPHIHESPWSMAGPLIVLAVPTVLLGLALGFPPLDGALHHWLEPVFHDALETLHIQHHEFELFGLDGVLMLIGASAGTLGVIGAIWLFGLLRLRRPREQRVERLSSGRLQPLYRASYNRWWFDELNDLIFVRIGGLFARALWWIDVRIVDGTVNGIAAVTQRAGGGIRQIQTGRVQNYALGIAVGLLVIAISYLFLGR
jgi:NADH-quinone oxidoreductase subunit L